MVLFRREFSFVDTLYLWEVSLSLSLPHSQQPNKQKAHEKFTKVPSSARPKRVSQLGPGVVWRGVKAHGCNLEMIEHCHILVDRNNFSLVFSITHVCFLVYS